MSQVLQTEGDVLDNVYVARQPIFDAQLNVVAYEVLFRSGPSNHAVIADGNQATSELLLNAFVEIGLDNVVGDKLAFVNLTREFLTGKYPLPREAGRLVLEILEDITIDDELIAAVHNLVGRGFTLALDDVVFHTDLIPLLNAAKIVKVELPRIPRPEWQHHVERFRRFPVQLLAEKIETRDEFELCKNLGFDLFQGYFLSRPQVLQGKRTGGNQLPVLRLLARLGNPRVTMDELEQIVKSDPKLSFKMLRYINSSHFSLRQPIQSLRQALAMLGIQGVRTVAMLVSMSEVKDRPAIILQNATLRALFCERLGHKLGQRDANAFFTAGLISAFDVVLDLPLNRVLELLPLSADILSALRHHLGPVGQAVHCARLHESAEGERTTCGHLTPREIRDAWLDAVAESSRLWTELSSLN